MTSTKPFPFRPLAIGLVVAIVICAGLRIGFGPRAEFAAHLFLPHEETGPDTDGFGIQSHWTEPAAFPRYFTEQAAIAGNLDYKIGLSGLLNIRKPGAYFFWIESNGDTEFFGEKINETGNTSLYLVKLDRGRHPFSVFVTYDKSEKEPFVSMSWSKDAGIPRPIPKGTIVNRMTFEGQFTFSAILSILIVLCLLSLVVLIAHRFLQPRAFRRVVFASVTVFGALMISLGVAELALRILGVEPREYVPGSIWFDYNDFPPGSTTTYMGWIPYNVEEFEVPVTMNEKGWRDREYAEAKPPGVYRILVLGDSYVEAKEVPLEATFHKVLERKLNEDYGTAERKFEVLAMGKGGSTTSAAYQFLHDYGLEYDPDLVVLSFFPGNDVRENSPELSEAYEKWTNEVYRGKVIPAKIEFIDRWLVFPWSYLNAFLVDRLAGFYVSHLHWFRSDLKKDDLISNEIEIYRTGEYPPVWQEAWSETKDLILRTKTLAEENGAEFMMMIAYSFQIPGLESEDADAEYDLLRPNEIAMEFCEEQGIECLNLEPELTEFREKTGEPYAWKYDAHWNEAGHRVAAQALFDVIAKDQYFKNE